MKDFHCSCKGCGKRPEFGVTEIWIETESGMLCESCWRTAVQENRRTSEGIVTSESEFCCFCALCKRTPPDPDYKIWIETEKGCLCEKCWKEVIGNLLAERIESAISEKKSERGPMDVQLGCCLLNKRLLNKALDTLSIGGYLEIIAENSESMKAIVKKYVDAKGCVITGINDNNGTCLITIQKVGRI